MKYEVHITATATVSQTVEVDAYDDSEAVSIASELAMCYFGDFEVDGTEDIKITSASIESCFEEC